MLVGYLQLEGMEVPRNEKQKTLFSLLEHVLDLSSSLPSCDLKHPIYETIFSEL